MLKVSLTASGRETAESYGQQSENIILMPVTIYFYASSNIFFKCHSYLPHNVNMQVIVVFLPGINNHCDAQLHALIPCLYTQDPLSCPEQVLQYSLFPVYKLHLSQKILEVNLSLVHKGFMYKKKSFLPHQLSRKRTVYINHFIRHRKPRPKNI